MLPNLFCRNGVGFLVWLCKTEAAVTSFHVNAELKAPSALFTLSPRIGGTQEHLITLFKRLKQDDTLASMQLSTTDPNALMDL